jgi:hypothetical protein
MSVSDDNALHEKPLEFLTSIASTGGSCDGQAILPDHLQPLGRSVLW